MASDGQSVKIPASSLVHGSQAPTVKYLQSGKIVPQRGNGAALAEAASNAKLHTQVAVLNKYLNDSGRPAQFRPSQDEKSIQEINPATGEVLAEYSAVEFAALARSVGISGAVIDERA